MKIIKLFCFFFILIPQIVLAHEQWFLSPQQIHDLNTQAKPIIFTQLTATNVSILLFTSLCVFLWIKLEHTGSREIFYNHQQQLAKYPNISAFILRIATVIMLLMAIFGLNPRSGVALFSASTLIFPDLVLQPAWEWIKWVELLMAFCLLLGIYVRIIAILIFLSGLLGVYLFGTAMLYYIGFVTAIAAYLFLQGAGIGQCTIPVITPLKNIYSFLKDQPASRAQFILRVLVGLDFAITGFICKYLHPNMAIGLLTAQHMPTFGLQIETVVFWMAIIETMAGALLCIGALTRPISFILLGCFAFMSYAISEPLYSHAIFYGVLFACYLNGAGQWAQPIAKDKSANILILGGNLSGIHCAITLERLLGKFSNVKVTLIHHENYFQFNPLLPDVISGYVRPSNILNPIRRICENLALIQGKAIAIDPVNQKVVIKQLSQKIRTLSYDELIIANDKLLDRSPVTDIDVYTIPIMNVGDAVYIREHIIECLEQAEWVDDINQRQHLLTFAIIGGGLRGTSVAAEVRNFIKSAINSYPHLSINDIRIILIDKTNQILPFFNDHFASSVYKKLLKMNIEVINNSDILRLQLNELVLVSGRKISSNTLISALSRYTSFLPEQAEINAYLQLKNYNNIFACGRAACIAKHIPFQAYYESFLGKQAAYNVWAHSQGYQLKQIKIKNPYFCAACLGPEVSTVQLGPIIISGRLAWIIARLISMYTLPGLERNLRVLIDWIFNIPFRPDIVSYVPSHLSKINENVEPISDSQDTR